MLFQKNQKKISSILRTIYKTSLNEKDIDHLKDQIILIIKKFNQKNSKKKFTISEKTSLVICYGDNVNSNQKSSIQVFQNFFKKNLKKYFNAIHFLPFYPSSSDSGFAVKDHYKIEKRIGNWSDIKKISKSNHVMADIVINHSSARGLWFKNFLKKKRPGKDYFLTVNSKFNTSKVVRPRDHKLLKKIDIFNKSDYIWRTFSDDQIDLDFNNPSVLLRFIKIMVHLVSNGVT
ncbi:alpha-amylase family glycosyl hydrolase, partial [Candidatus Pelagibacter sp.]|nr:alpha-amylase family glycosyl hydrolase [Candidatus Pelagibacter sp.]